MKYVIFLTLFLIVSYSAQSQVGGISASKLGAFCCQTVKPKTIEFEPAFAVYKSNKYWNTDKKLTNTYSTTDSVDLFNEFNFRFTYGIMENFEVGISVPSDMSGSSIGLKYDFPFSEKYHTAAIFGINTPLGIRTVDKSTAFMSNTTAFAGGLVFSSHFTEKLMLDFDVQYQKFIKKVGEDHKGDIFLDADFAYWVMEDWQWIAGLGYSKSNYKDTNFNSQLLSLNIGCTIETAENFLLVIYSPIDIWGQNSPKSIGLSFALTTTIR